MRVAVIETKEVNEDAGLSVFDEQLNDCSPFKSVVVTKADLRLALHKAVSFLGSGEADESKVLVISGHGAPGTGGCLQLSVGEVVDWKVDFEGYFSCLPSGTVVFASYCWGAAPCFQHALPRAGVPLVGFLVKIDENHHRDLLHEVLQLSAQSMPGDGVPFIDAVHAFNERWSAFYDAPASRVVLADRTQVPRSQSSMTSPSLPEAKAVVVAVHSGEHGGPRWVVVKNPTGYFRVPAGRFDAAAYDKPLSLIGRSFRIPCKVVNLPSDSAAGMLEVMSHVYELLDTVPVPPPYAYSRDGECLVANAFRALVPPHRTMATCVACCWASIHDVQTEDRVRLSFAFCRRADCPEHEVDGVALVQGDADAVLRGLLAEAARQARARRPTS